MTAHRLMSLNDLIQALDAPMGEALNATIGHLNGTFAFNHFDTSMMTSSSMVELNLLPEDDTSQVMTLQALREELTALVRTLGDICPTSISLYLWDDGDRFCVTHLTPSPSGFTVFADEEYCS
ncbi:hypothetical protein AB6D11_02545 [Vibrio splendidus]